MNTSDKRRLNQHLEAQGKLGVSPDVRRDLKRRRLLGGGGKAATPAPKDAAAFVRALLER